MRDAGRREIRKRRGAGREGGTAPLVDQVVRRSPIPTLSPCHSPSWSARLGWWGCWDQPELHSPVSRSRAAIRRVGIAGDGVVAFRDVVKDAGISGQRHRRGIAARAVLCRQLVENVIGIPLARAQSLRRHFLIDQRHDAREGGGRGRGSTDAQEGEVCQAARSRETKEARICLADDVKAVVEAIAREQRDVRQYPALRPAALPFPFATRACYSPRRMRQCCPEWSNCWGRRSRRRCRGNCC